MSFILVQGGTSLYKVDPTTGTATTLTLPTNVTLSTTRKPKFAVLNQWVAMTNSPSRNLVIDPEGVVRVMVPRAPIAPPNVAVGSGTGLTGAYTYKTSFVVIGSDGSLAFPKRMRTVAHVFSPASAGGKLSRARRIGSIMAWASAVLPSSVSRACAIRASRSWSAFVVFNILYSLFFFYRLNLDFPDCQPSLVFQAVPLFT